MNDILRYKDYIASVHFSAEDEVFFGKVLGIDDLLSFEGNSVAELKKSFREAVEDYLQSCSELGKEPNKTYKGTFNVRINTELHKQAAAFAAIHNVSLNDLVGTAIGFALSREQDLADNIANQTFKVVQAFTRVRTTGKASNSVKSSARPKFQKSSRRAQLAQTPKSKKVAR